MRFTFGALHIHSLLLVTDFHHVFHPSSLNPAPRLRPHLLQIIALVS